ncbi:UNVERIFIED_ORG: class I SAM-dependent methyltransferase [Shinella sp. XGS7]|nr:class I SAM-dependent methyltransferase [Shinella sp. XGS7]
MKVIRLRAGRERSLQRRHPWVFESAIAKGGADPGETVRVESAEGEFLAWAAFSPSSQIRVRAWSFDAAERIDAAFFERRIAQALAMRERLQVPSDAVRLVHGESDGLPGLIVDRYGETLVAQFGAAGVERWKTVIVEALLRQTGLKRFYERSDASVRALEGLPEQTGWLAGEGATELTLREHDWRLSLDIATGHKTGYYLDQRDNRRRFAEVVRQHGCKRVLNCFSYTGGFSVAALAGGAERVISVDSSGPALARASAHVALNGFEAARHEALDADVNKTLRALIAAGEQFDAIVLDPPKLAPTSAHAERAARAYKDINRLGLKLLAPGGLLFTFSCSGGVGPELFHKIVAGAGMDAQVDAYILERVAAAPDHPQTLYFPEGDYLKGLLLLKQG